MRFKVGQEVVALVGKFQDDKGNIAPVKKNSIHRVEGVLYCPCCGIQAITFLQKTVKPTNLICNNKHKDYQITTTDVWYYGSQFFAPVVSDEAINELLQSITEPAVQELSLESVEV